MPVPSESHQVMFSQMAVAHAALNQCSTGWRGPAQPAESRAILGSVLEEPYFVESQTKVDQSQFPPQFPPPKTRQTVSLVAFDTSGKIRPFRLNGPRIGNLIMLFGMPTCPST